MRKTIIAVCALLCTISATAADGWSDRGFAGVATPDGFHLSWRVLPSDKASATYEVWRSTDGGREVKVSASAIRSTSDFFDSQADMSKDNVWTLKCGGKSIATFSRPAGDAHPYIEVPLSKPSDRAVYRINERFYGATDQYNPGDESDTYSYSAGDCSVGDLDGDGQMEIILKWDPSNASIPERTGLTGNTLIDAYKLDGTLLWRIDLGHNVRSTYSSTGFIVYDLDSDGCAELVCKTGDATVDGVGTVLGNIRADWRSMDESSESFGRVVIGPEYITVFDGRSGKAIDSQKFVPLRFPLTSWGGLGGDDKAGVKSEKYSAGVAYLDGTDPYVYFVRGGDARTIVAAWKYSDRSLSLLWSFDTSDSSGVSGASGIGNGAFAGSAGTSSIAADVDGDGCDEICVGAMVVDHDGTGLVSTKLRYGQALAVGHFVPSRPGLQVFGTHDTTGALSAYLQNPAVAMYDAATGEVLWSMGVGESAGRGVAADIDPRYPGAECWVGSVDPDPSRVNSRGFGGPMPGGPAPGGAPSGPMPGGPAPGGASGNAPGGPAPGGALSGPMPGGPAPGGAPSGPMPGMPQDGPGMRWMGVQQTLPEYDGPLRGVYTATGEKITDAAPSSCNFTVYWDADTLSELLDGTTVSKWDYANATTQTLLKAEGVKSIGGTHAVPCFVGDMLGDWREEIIWVTSDDTALRIYMTPVAAQDRRTTLSAARRYRTGIASENIGHNQPAYIDIK